MVKREPLSPGRPNVIRGVLLRWTRQRVVVIRESVKDAVWLALKVEEGALNQGIQAASKSRKR